MTTTTPGTSTKAMILAAGRGTRARPLSLTAPKPMIPILGRPVLERLLQYLSGSGFREVVINTSYRAAEIEDALRDGSSLGLSIGYSFEGYVDAKGVIVDEPLGSAGGMRRVQDHSGFFDSTFVVLCGDALIDVDLQDVVAEHRRRGALATLVGKRVPPEEVASYGVVVADASGHVASFQEKPQPKDAKSNLVNTGIYVFEPRIFDFIPTDGVYDIGSQLFPDLVARGESLYVSERDFRWVDLGSAKDYWSASQYLLTEGQDLATPPGRELRPGVFVGTNVAIDFDRVDITGPVVIGSSCSIAPGATIVGPTVIGKGSVVGPDVTLVRSVVCDRTRVWMAPIENAIYTPEHIILNNGNVIPSPALSGVPLVVDRRAPGFKTGALHVFPATA
jgi:mannose-1-phosphate guanylyltransferase